MSIDDYGPRVVRISADEYWLPDGAQRWRICRERDVWVAYDQYGQLSSAVGWKDTAEEAIAAVIGDQR